MSNQKEITQITRSDGETLNPQNYWMENGSIKIADDPEANYTVSFLTPVHVTNVTSVKPTVCQSFPLRVHVTVENHDINVRSFNVTAYADSNTTVFRDEITIGTKNLTLAGGNTTTVPFRWNTTGVALGYYNISATVDVVPGTADSSDVTHVDGWNYVAYPGDINGDGIVDVFDLSTLGQSFGYFCGSPGYNIIADITDDCLVDARDLAVITYYYGESGIAAEAKAASPEAFDENGTVEFPSLFVLPPVMMLVVLAGLAYRRKNGKSKM